jgi:hypothetical protein
MKKLMTKHFSKWVSKQNIPKHELFKSLTEVEAGRYEALIKELLAFKELSKILLNLSDKEIATTIENGNLIEINP